MNKLSNPFVYALLMSGFVIGPLGLLISNRIVVAWGIGAPTYPYTLSGLTTDAVIGAIFGILVTALCCCMRFHPIRSVRVTLLCFFPVLMALDLIQDWMAESNAQKNFLFHDLANAVRIASTIGLEAYLLCLLVQRRVAQQFDL